MADPAEYVGLWLTDAGEDGKSTGSDRSAAARLAENWLDYLAAERVQGIGMGLITLRRNRFRAARRSPWTRSPDRTRTSPATRRPASSGAAAWVERTTDAELLATGSCSPRR